MVLIHALMPATETEQQCSIEKYFQRFRILSSAFGSLLKNRVLKHYTFAQMFLGFTHYLNNKVFTKTFNGNRIFS